MRMLRTPSDMLTNPETTKSKIILTAAEQFALSGYSTVSIREIAKASGILPGSIYAHFSSKQDILDTMMNRYGEELRDFYVLLDKLTAEAGSLSDILEDIFAEIKDSANSFSCNVIWCAMNTQFEFPSSRTLFYDIFYVEGHEAIRRQLETAIRRSIAPAFDPEEIAFLITNCIVATLSFQVGKVHGYYPDLDITSWCTKQIDHILRVAEMTGRLDKQ